MVVNAASTSLTRVVTRALSDHDASLCGRDVIIACSGGVDSVVAADVIAELPGGSRPRSITLWHADHGLRDDDAGARAVVEALADRIDAQLIVATPAAGTLDAAAGNLQSDARDWRRAELVRVAADVERPVIVTGHHADDQLETVLYRLVSTSGATALTGIALSADMDGVPVVRPLLTVSRRDIETHAHTRGLAWAHDPSNDDTRRFRRNRLRHDVVPELLDIHPGAGANITRTADQLRDQVELTRALARELMLHATGTADSDRPDSINNSAAIALLDVHALAAYAPLVRDEVIAEWLRSCGAGRALSARCVAQVAQLTIGDIRGGHQGARIAVGRACVRRDQYLLVYEHPLSPDLKGPS